MSARLAQCPATRVSQHHWRYRQDERVPPGVPRPGSKPSRRGCSGAQGLPPPPGRALTVAAREAAEAFGTRIASRPREVRPAVAAARQVLARPVREVRLAVTAWAGGGKSGEPKSRACRPREGAASASPAWEVGREPWPPREPRRPPGHPGLGRPCSWTPLGMPPPRPPQPGRPHSRRQAWGESSGWSGER